ncbi:MAG: HAD-IIIC family phosphatase [Lachnospiraceae bacterium]|nr:HAD-IIIC family phosphatase [Lachnospiraceae bacterium]
MRELEYPFDAEFILKKKRALRKKLIAENGNMIEKRVAVLGGATTDDIVKILELFLLNYGIRPVFYESEFNRFYEDGMFQNIALENFKPDIIYIHTSIRNINENEFPVMKDDRAVAAQKINDVYLRFEELWKHLSETYNCPIIQNNFQLPFYRLMGNKDATDYRGKVNFISRLNIAFYDYADTHENFYIHDINYESASYGLEKWSDPFYWHMYKYDMSVHAIPYSTFNVANIIKSVFGKNKKVLNLDLDNTLWGGVIGDAGAESIEIGQETSLGQTYAEFQKYILAHKDLGVLLTVNSKNSEDTALQGFERPDSILKREDFISFKANWNSKAENLAETADELGLLPESFVFVDDNPAEREMIRQNFPEAAVVEMKDVEHYIGIIDKSGYFEVTELSREDGRRSEMYRENMLRNRARQSCENYEEYLVSLEMKAEIKSFVPIYMSRIAQLTNKSNQFNLTTRRYSQSELEKIAEDPLYVTLYGKLEDKFGDNGVVSVIIGHREKGDLHIDLWLMSCRVLKRDMEFAMMDELVHLCRENGIKKLRGYYYLTAKNSMVKSFYGLQGFTKVSEDLAGNSVWEYVIEPLYVNKNRVIKVNGGERQ